jgi:hypothetical protein
MTSPYLSRPALKLGDGYLVFLSVQKRFPAFLRCHALYFLSDSEFAHTELSATALEFRNAVAKLPPSPILGPVSGGAPLILYLAARGLEEDFRELAGELQENDLIRLADLSDSILIIFGASSIDTTRWGTGPAPQAVPSPEPPPPQPEPEPAPAPVVELAPEPVSIEPPPPAPEPEPSPPPVFETMPTSPAPAPEPVPLPEPRPVEVVAAKPESPLAPVVSDAIGVDAFARELSRLFGKQQDAIAPVVQSAVVAAQAESLRQQIDALKKAQADWAAQQASLTEAGQADLDRRLQAALARWQTELSNRQAAALDDSREGLANDLKALLIQMYDDHAEAQRQAIAEFKKEVSSRLQDLQSAPPEWATKMQKDARQAQEDQETKLAAALKTLEDTATWLRSQSVTRPEPAPTAETKVDPMVESTVKELGWKVENNTNAMQSVQSRVGRLLALNVLLWLTLVGAGVCVGAFVLFPTIRSWVPSGPVAVATASPVGVAPNASQAAATQPPRSDSTLTLNCADADQSRAFYECTITNTADDSQSLTLMISAQDNEVNGFFYSVAADNSNITSLADPELPRGAASFPVGHYQPGESKRVRVNLACIAAGGCESTTFTLAVLGEGVELPDNEINITTFYAPP